VKTLRMIAANRLAGPPSSLGAQLSGIMASVRQSLNFENRMSVSIPNPICQQRLVQFLAEGHRLLVSSKQLYTQEDTDALYGSLVDWNRRVWAFFNRELDMELYRRMRALMIRVTFDAAEGGCCWNVLGPVQTLSLDLVGLEQLLLDASRCQSSGTGVRSVQTEGNRL
jgi:hypothetical protein